MQFVIAIEPGTESTAFGVVVPDLPGCFSAGDSLEQAIENARESIALWCETVIEDGGTVPTGKTLDEHQANPEYAGWTWVVVDVALPSSGVFGSAWGKRALANVQRMTVDEEFRKTISKDLS